MTQWRAGAQVLTWTLFALMQQPDVERKLLAELDAEVGDDAVSASPNPNTRLFTRVAADKTD